MAHYDDINKKTKLVHVYLTYLAKHVHAVIGGEWWPSWTRRRFSPIVAPLACCPPLHVRQTHPENEAVGDEESLQAGNDWLRLKPSRRRWHLSVCLFWTENGTKVHFTEPWRLKERRRGKKKTSAKIPKSRKGKCRQPPDGTRRPPRSQVNSNVKHV